MVTYPVWPCRTFARCKGHSSDLDNSSFRSNASLDADGRLHSRSGRVGEKISPACGMEVEGGPRVVSAMIAFGHDHLVLRDQPVPSSVLFSHPRRAEPKRKERSWTR